VKGDAIADGRRRSDDAVRRLREESARRIARCRVPGMSQCMLGTMVALLLFVALQARRIHWIAEANDAWARGLAACTNYERRRVEIEVTARERMAAAFDVEQRRSIEVRLFDQMTTAHRFALEAGCEAAPPPRPLPTPPKPCCLPVSAVWYVE
jgi:hypothetical protein